MNILHITRQKGYEDHEVVSRLQAHERKVEDWFYNKAKRYFDDHFNAVFFDKDKKQEIFQTAFLKLWMEIDNGRISVREQAVCRQQKDGEYRRMACSLTTFLMAFAKTEHRELVRSVKEDFYADLYDQGDNMDPSAVFDSEDPEEQKNRIVDECISQMPPRCLEILTLFYYEGRTLDEILDIRKEKNASKNGLKTAKNKCMNTLRSRITTEFDKYHFKY